MTDNNVEKIKRLKEINVLYAKVLHDAGLLSTEQAANDLKLSYKEVAAWYDNIQMDNKKLEHELDFLTSQAIIRYKEIRDLEDRIVLLQEKINAIDGLILHSSTGLAHDINKIINPEEYKYGEDEKDKNDD